MENASSSLVPQFKQLLTDFRLSDEAKKVLGETTFVPLAAISSSGRNTIIRELLKSGKYYFTVSDTSRRPRDNDGVMEQDGVEYWFKTEADMLEQLQQGEYLEAAVIHTEHIYGTHLSELRRAHADGKIAITDMDPQGVKNVMTAQGKTIPVFLLPPSYEEWRRRIEYRGKMSPEALKNRELSAIMELDLALNEPYYHFVINDDLAEAVREVDAIASGLATGRQEEGRRLAKELQDRIKADQLANS